MWLGIHSNNRMLALMQTLFLDKRILARTWKLKAFSSFSSIGTGTKRTVNELYLRFRSLAPKMAVTTAAATAKTAST